MAGEWIAGKARGLLGMFPGQWEEVQPEIWQGRCPGEHLHHGHNAATDCRIHTCYGAGGQPPGIYCLHSSCKGVLEALNHDFREALFAKDPDWKPGPRPNDGVVERAPRAKEAWIPDYDEAVLEKTVRAVPEVDAEWFMRRSPVDPRGVGPGEFLEHVFQPGELALVFTNFKSQGDFLWQAGTGGWRLSDRRGVRAVRSRLPVDGGKDGVWFLSNPADGKWHPNPRRQGAYSRRSMESITAWRHLVLESDVAPEGLWLRLLAMCPVPVVAIYSSGGRSWHALCRVDMASKADFDSRMRTDVKLNAPLLGADPGAMTPVRLTRLPGCTRGGRMQRLIFLHPRARELQPILNLPELRTIEHGKGNE